MSQKLALATADDVVPRPALSEPDAAEAPAAAPPGSAS